jgi:hypothetical protein
MIDGERYHVLPVPELQQEERHAAGHSCRRKVPPQREQGPLQVRGPEAIVPIRIRFQSSKSIQILTWTRGSRKWLLYLSRNSQLAVFTRTEVITRNSA